MKYLSTLALILVPLLVGCPELDELNRRLNGSSSTPNTSSSSTIPVKVTAKQFTLPDRYYLYYTDGSYDLVTKATYNSTKIGDSKLVTTFSPPASKVVRKFFTQDYRYIIECDNQTRKNVELEQYDRINVGDICP